MRFIICSLLLVSTLYLKGQGPEYNWTVKMGGTGLDDCNSICTDELGNILATGTFSGIVDFDSGPGTSTLSAIKYDAFVTKHDSHGNLIWAKSFGGNNWDIGNYIKTDLQGNVYITGGFQYTVDFDPGPAVYTVSPQGHQNFFILKLDYNGNFVWVKTSSTNYIMDASSLAFDQQGNIYATGWFYGIADFDPGIGTFTIVAQEKDVFILKLDSDGNFVWAKSFGGPADEYGNSIAVSKNGEIAVCGNYSSTCDFDPGFGSYTLTSSGAFDLYILKLDSAGNFVFALSMGSSQEHDNGYSILFDKMGNIYSTGSTYINNNSMFLCKLSTIGNILWLKTMTSTGGSNGISLLQDNSGNIYVAGSFWGSCDFDWSISSDIIVSNACQSAYVMKLDSSGNYSWVKCVTGIGTSYGASAALTGSNEVLLAGAFYGTCDFDPGAQTMNVTSMNGDWDAYILKLGAPINSMPERSNENSIKVFPNPSSGLFNFDLDENTKLRIFDSRGILIKEEEVKAPGCIDISDQPPGQYFLGTQTKGKTVITRIIKE